MRITVDLTPFLHNGAGLGRYAAELTQALLATRSDNEQFELFYNDSKPQPLPLGFSQMPTWQIELSSKPWRLWVMLAHWLHQPQDKIMGTPDVFLATAHLLPYFKQTAGIFTIGDVTFISHAHTHSRLNRIYLQMMMPLFLRQAAAIVAISHCTLADVQALYPVIANKGHVVYPAVSQQFQPVLDPVKLAEIRQIYHLPESFLFYVGTIEPRKNLPTLFEAVRAIKTNHPYLKLVIAGKKGWLYQQTFAQLQTLGLAEDVVFTGYVSDEDLPALYTMATAFVYPSLYEGFGLPLLEAMACGVPIICSNNSSLPEVAGDAALMVEATDVTAWAETINQLILNPNLQGDLRERGFRQAHRFTWETTARNIRNIYQSL